MHNTMQHLEELEEYIDQVTKYSGLRTGSDWEGPNSGIDQSQWPASSGLESHNSRKDSDEEKGVSWRAEARS